MKRSLDLALRVVLLALGPTLAATAHATTIIIRRTPEYIVVGADSLWSHDTLTTDKNGRKRATHSVSFECKINQFHHTFFAHAGYAGLTD